MRVGSKDAIDIGGDEEAAEMVSHIDSEGSAEDPEEGEEGHDDNDKELPAERVEEVRSSG